MQPSLYSGARIVVQINNETIAAGHLASWNIMHNAEEIETIDMVFPAELAPQRIRVGMNLRIYRSPDNDPVLANYMPSTYSGPNNTEQAVFTQKKYISILVKDNLDNTIFSIPKAWINSRSMSVAVGDLMTETWAIAGIGYSGPSV